MSGSTEEETTTEEELEEELTEEEELDELTDDQKKSGKYIPKTRFDKLRAEMGKVALELKDLKGEKDKKEAEKLKVEGKYEELWKKEEAKRTTAETEVATLTAKIQQMEIAIEYNISLKLARAIEGSTKEEMEISAQELVDELGDQGFRSSSANGGSGQEPTRVRYSANEAKARKAAGSNYRPL